MLPIHRFILAITLIGIPAHAPCPYPESAGIPLHTRDDVIVVPFNDPAALEDAFAAHGNVSEVNLMMDRSTGRSRGFAFVTMSSPEEAQKAIDAMSGHSLDGRALTVNVARPRAERPAGGGGGGRRYGGGYSRY